MFNLLGFLLGGGDYYDEEERELLLDLYAGPLLREQESQEDGLAQEDEPVRGQMQGVAMFKINKRCSVCGYQPVCMVGYWTFIPLFCCESTRGGKTASRGEKKR